MPSSMALPALTACSAITARSLSGEDGLLAEVRRGRGPGHPPAARTYALLLLRASFHPDLLRDAPRPRPAVRPALGRRSRDLPWLTRVIPSEPPHDLLQRRSRLHRDPPRLTGPLDQLGGAGSRVLRRPGLDLARRRLLDAFSDEDLLAHQLWIIRLTRWRRWRPTTSRRNSPCRSRPHRRPCPTGRGCWPRPGRSAISSALALRGEREIAWIGLKLAPKGHWSLAPMGPELYDGIAGIGLFLAALSAQ